MRIRHATDLTIRVPLVAVCGDQCRTSPHAAGTGLLGSRPVALGGATGLFGGF